MSFNSAGSLAAGAADSPLLVTTTQLQIPALKVKTSGAHTEPGANKRGAYGFWSCLFQQQSGKHESGTETKKMLASTFPRSQ